jgi:serine/threonine protein kinase
MKENPSMMMETIPPGTILRGRYRIERALGSGGFGHVYLAVDLQTGQQYAVKEYFVSGSGGQAQLQHEAQVLSQLHHTSLPAFHEAFHERGRYFVVLSYIEGNDLTDLLRVARQRNEVIPLTRILSWIVSICDAVSFMHSQSPPVIHRDIKPDNIRIKSDGTAMLVDLGNAKTAADGARTLFFIRHQGTPGYAPQEQYPGGTGTDERSDIFALGGTLYFALTTHEPPNVSTRSQAMQQGQPDLPSLQSQCANNSPEEASNADTGRQFRSGSQRGAKPVQRNIRHLAQLSALPPQLLDQLNRIIMRAMAMRPRDRYQSVVELRNDLQKVLDALPNSSSPAASMHRVIDPNSTQPDLPMLYETIQEAKAQQAAMQVNATQPQQATVSMVNCPRCNAQLLPNASFCPSCGSSLNSAPKDKELPQTVEPRIQHLNAMPPKTPVIRDTSQAAESSLDSTVIIKPQGQGQKQTMFRAQVRTPDPAKMPPTRPPSTPSPGSIPPKPKLTQAHQQVSLSKPALMPPNTPLQTGNQQSQPRRSDFALRPGFLMLLIALAVVVIILVVILVVLLNSHGHAHVSYTIQSMLPSFWQISN